VGEQEGPEILSKIKARLSKKFLLNKGTGAGGEDSEVAGKLESHIICRREVQEGGPRLR